jgi:predicted  nucleic acid-binding Zn-ribbon protein
MASLTNQIQEAIPRNRELLAILAKTDHAVPDLKQHRLYIADLDSRLPVLQQRLRELDRKRTKEFKEHKTYRESMLRRFAYKASGNKDKFDAKAAKEEKDYFQALQEEQQAKEQEKNLKGLQEEARRALGELERQAERHVRAQKDLNELYSSIFTGPSPEFPEEDSRERRYARAVRDYQDARERAEAQGLAVMSLRQASKRFRTALGSIDEALDHSRLDMFGGGSMADMLERNALHKAEIHISDAYWLVAQARRADPDVHDLPPVKIAQDNIMSDVMFDNIFSDMAFHDRIKDSRDELIRSGQVLEVQLQGAQGKLHELDWIQRDKSDHLEIARAELQKAREEIFEKMAAGMLSAQPPTYDKAQMA